MCPTDVAMSRRQVGAEVPMVASELTDNSIYTGLFGSIDSARMASITESLIQLADERQVQIAIIDLSNVDAIDSSVAAYMVKLGKTLELVGVSSVFCGISGPLASTMIGAGLDLGRFRAVRDLKAALQYSFEATGYRLVRMDPHNNGSNAVRKDPG